MQINDYLKLLYHNKTFYFSILKFIISNLILICVDQPKCELSDLQPNQ